MFLYAFDARLNVTIIRAPPRIIAIVCDILNKLRVVRVTVASDKSIAVDVALKRRQKRNERERERIEQKLENQTHFNLSIYSEFINIGTEHQTKEEKSISMCLNTGLVFIHQMNKNVKSG